ncbi:MAG: radical SAM protein, partial [archaeon]|nr:radical SAM protein [archaeon]
YDPEYICISVSTPNYFQALELAKKFKHKNNVLIAGGNHITDNPNEQRTQEAFDYLITGDGEEALNQVIKNKPQQKVINGGKSLDPNLLPIPDYNGLKFERYFMTVEGKKGAVVITSRGCLYNCMYCLASGTRITTSRSPNKSIANIQIGEKLIAYNEGQLVETTVVDKFKRKEQDLIRLILEDGTKILTTKEHPFYMYGDWVEAGKLKIGNILHHITFNDKISFNKIVENPMKRKEVSIKMSKTREINGHHGKNGTLSKECKKRWELGINHSSPMSEENKQLTSIRMTENNPMFNPITAKKVGNTMKLNHEKGISIPYFKTPKGRIVSSLVNQKKAKENNPMKNPEVSRKVNSPENQKKRLHKVKSLRSSKEEKYCHELIDSYYPNSFIHNDNFEINIGKYFPDFINEEKKKIIEYNGCFFHNCKECFPNKHNKENNKDDILRAEYYKKEGYQTLFVYGHELQNEPWKLIPKIGDFLTNGLKIIKIEHLKKTMDVYNLKCEPYDNFFANYVLVHNCGSAKLKKWRPRSPENVMEELRVLYHKYDIRGFYFADDIITTPRKQDQERFIKICQMIKEEMPDVVFRATTRADTLSEDLCKAMGEAGCKWVSLGIESGSDTVLKAMNKYMGVEQQEKGIDLCMKYGVGIKGFFIAGLPGETKETMQETLSWVKKIKEKYGDKFITDIYMLVPSPGAPVWDTPEKFGLDVYKSDDWEKYNQILVSEQPLFKHPNLSHEELQDFINEFKKVAGENKSTV